MKTIKELSYTQLKNYCSPSEFSFQTTAELESLDGIIGQERAVKALDFGLAVKMKGYNIYMAGPSGTGKTTYAKRSAEKLAAAEAVPSDWCYVYNFQNPKKPAAISFEAGAGKKFVEDMTKLVANVKRELHKLFQSDDYERQKLIVLQSYDQKQVILAGKLEELAAEYDFQVETTEQGISFIPLVNGETIDEQTFFALTEEAQIQIEEKSQIVHEKSGSIFREIQKLEKECDQALDELDKKLSFSAIGHYFEELSVLYQEQARVILYLEAVKNDVLNNLSCFMEKEEDSEDTLSALLPMFNKY